MVLQAIQVAKLPFAVYLKTQQFFSMFQKGLLKGQKQRKLKGSTLNKAIGGKFEPKLTHFKIIQGLSVSPCMYRKFPAFQNTFVQQVEKRTVLLDKLVNKQITFEEAAKKSKEWKCDSKQELSDSLSLTQEETFYLLEAMGNQAAKKLASIK